MTEKKKVYVDSAWENNPNYFEKKGVCDFCNQRDLLKLSFDQIRYICTNASACVLRWRKSRLEKV